MASMTFCHCTQQENNLKRIVLIMASCLLATACGNSESGSADAKDLAKALSGDNAGAAADNPKCKLFTRAEAGAYIGETVDLVENAAMGTGCMWSNASESGSLLVQVVPADYHETPSGADGYVELTHIGEEAFVVPEMSGWHAGTLQGELSIHVQLDGPGASEAKTVELLQETMKRDAASP